jgi:predicted ATP-grasp superfamily ATP-dependent carboligase
MTQRVLLTDTHWRTSYYVCKSLAKRNIDVIGLSSAESIYERSIYYTDVLSLPSLELYPREWLDRVEQIANENDILLPISPQAIKLVAFSKAQFAKKILTPPTPSSQMEFALDKSKTLKYMANIGIPIPLTFFPRSFDEVLDVIDQTKFPVVLKLNQEGNIPPLQRYGIARNLDELKEIYRVLSSIQTSLIMQQYIKGDGVGISILANNGIILASYAHRRLREMSVKGGPSTYASYFDSSVLRDYALSFTEKSKWSGLAMLEFKYDHQSDSYCFMEINPRFWGTVELAIKSGIDFPYLFLEWIRGNNNVSRVKQKKIRLKYLSMDLAAFSFSLHDMNNTERLRSILSYAREYFDPDLHYNIDLKDWQVSLWELVRSSQVLGSVIRHSI